MGSDPPGLSTDDQLQIIGLLARYNHAVDSGDADAYLATFVETGVLRIEDMEFAGREGLTQVVTSPQRTPGQHVSVNVVIEGDGRRATVRSYGQMLTMSGDPRRPVVVAMGRFEDDVAKIDGTWRFVTRSYVRDR